MGVGQGAGKSYENCPRDTCAFTNNKLKVKDQCLLTLCTSQFQSRPSPRPRAIPGHLTRVKLRTVGNLTQNEARPVGHLTLCQNVCQRSEAKGFCNAGEPRSWVIALFHSTWGFLLFSFYIVLSWNMPLFKVWSEDKLNKKFVVAENFAALVSKGKRFCLYSFIS